MRVGQAPARRLILAARSNGNEANCYGSSPYGTEQKGPYLDRTTTVGSYRPNAFGLYDMHGNVWEMCQDWHDAYYGNSPPDDPTGPTSGSARVHRGGAWNSPADECRSADRHYYEPESRGHNLGFRALLVPVDKQGE